MWGFGGPHIANMRGVISSRRYTAKPRWEHHGGSCRPARPRPPRAHPSPEEDVSSSPILEKLAADVIQEEEAAEEALAEVVQEADSRSALAVDRVIEAFLPPEEETEQKEKQEDADDERARKSGGGGDDGGHPRSVASAGTTAHDDLHPHDAENQEHGKETEDGVGGDQAKPGINITSSPSKRGEEKEKEEAEEEAEVPQHGNVLQGVERRVEQMVRGVVDAARDRVSELTESRFTPEEEEEMRKLGASIRGCGRAHLLAGAAVLVVSGPLQMITSGFQTERFALGLATALNNVVFALLCASAGRSFTRIATDKSGDIRYLLDGTLDLVDVFRADAGLLILLSLVQVCWIQIVCP